MLTKRNIPAGLIENDDDGVPQIFNPQIITINSFSTYCASQFAAIFNSIVNSPQPIVYLSINSEGGSVFELNQMRDLILNSPKPVLGFGAGMVFSAASLLLSSCTKGYRWMGPSAKLMIHEVATSSEGKSSDIISDALETEKLNDELFEILAKNAGKPKSFFKNLVRKRNNTDFFLSAKDCLELNLIDRVGVPEILMDVKVDWSIRNLTKETPAKKSTTKKPKKTKPAPAPTE